MVSEAKLSYDEIEQNIGLFISSHILIHCYIMLSSILCCFIFFFVDFHIILYLFLKYPWSVKDWEVLPHKEQNLYFQPKWLIF